MNEILYFGSETCGACKEQKKILRKHFKGKVNYINIDRFPERFKYIKATPTWAIPQGNNKYILHEGIINDPGSLSAFGKTRRTRFGESVPLYPNINDLAVYGKTFPNGKGFEIPNSFYKTIENVWGKGDDTLNAGIGGTRSLGPDNISEMYSNGYFNNIRMAHPSDQLGTALYLNTTCNTLHKPSTMTESPGMIFDSKNPQIVSMTTGFGKKNLSGNKKNLSGNKKNLFGKNTYGQMGPAYEIGNQYLIDKDTGKQLYSGARQDENSRPYSVNNKYIYVGQAPTYNPIGKSQSFPSFGNKDKAEVKKCKTKKVKKCKTKKVKVIGEGTTLKVENGKIKIN